MKYLASFLMLILVYSCGDLIEKLDDIKDRDDSSRRHSSTDPAFSSYIASFEAEGKAYLIDPAFSVGDIPINFGDTEGTSVGVCFSYSNGQKEIIIKKQTWDSLPSIREVLIYHELGHCRLNRGHDNSLAPNVTGNDKLSILNEVLVSGSNYNQHRDAYVKELFTQDKTDIMSALTGN